MPRSRHRVEPLRPPLRRPLLALVTAGVGASMLAAVLVVTPWAHSESGQAVHALTPDDERVDAATEFLENAASLRAEKRTSRDRSESPQPTAPAKPIPAAKPRDQRPVVVRRLWLTSDVTVRSRPSITGDRIGKLEAGTRANVTAATESGWVQVVMNGRIGWVPPGFLSKSQPAAQTKSAAPGVPGVSSASCSISSSIEAHLTSNARSVYRAVCAAFGRSVSAFGGYRPGDPGDHGSGRAVDIMVSGDPGLEIARYVQAHARELHVKYVIYQQHIWLAGRPTGQWRLMEDRGSTTANHYDHVHVSVV